MTDIVGNETVRSLWDGLSARCGDRVFLVFHDREHRVSEYTYRSFDEEINRAANAFLSMGVEKGERIAVHMHSSPEFMMCLFGLGKIGAVAVPVNEQNKREECEYAVATCGCTCAVVEPAYLPLYEAMAANGTLAKGIVLARAEARLANAVDFADLRAAQSPVLADLEPICADDPLEIMFTSGTTACPKGVVLTHCNMLFAGLYGDWQVRLEKSDRLLTTMPACHSNFQFAALAPVLTAGATLVVVEKYSASRFWDQVAQHDVTVLQLVSMMLRTLLLQPERPVETAHHVREALYYLAVIDEEKEAFERRFRVSLLNSYGSTESVGWAITDVPSAPRNWPSVGRPGLSYEAKIVDDAGAELGPGQLGEICARGVAGRTLMKCYYNDPRATARVLSEDGWFRTGDKGYVDEDGWFFFVDRKSNMIKRAGENISASEVEGVLMEHPCVAEAAVIGVPDPIRDQAVKAFLVLREGERVSDDGLIAYCRRRLAEFKVPTIIAVVDELPHTSVGKIAKKLLA